MTSTKQIVASQNILRMAVEIDDPRLPQRFWDKVQIDSSTVVVAGKEYTGCWMWTAGKSSDGYGSFSSEHGRYSGLAHLRCYTTLVGPVPKGLELDHLCRRPPCVNPAHLEPVPHKVNMERGEIATKQFCNYGHEFTDANTYREEYDTDKGLWHRHCRTCGEIRHASPAYLEQSHRWQQENREHLNQYNHNWRQENLEHVHARDHIWYDANKDRINAKKRVGDMTAEQHKAKRDTANAYTATHRDKINARQNARSAAKRADPRYVTYREGRKAAARARYAANKDTINARRRTRYHELKEVA